MVQLLAPRGPFGDIEVSPSGENISFIGSREDGPARMTFDSSCRMPAAGILPLAISIAPFSPTAGAKITACCLSPPWFHSQAGSHLNRRTRRYRFRFHAVFHDQRQRLHRLRRRNFTEPQEIWLLRG
jgi:hypothetical protein